MKKLISLCIVFLGITVQAQDVQWLKAYELSVNYEGWSDWEPVNIDIKIDFDNYLIKIFSKQIQIYEILSDLPPLKDDDGRNIRFRVIDQDKDIGVLTFRVQNNGTKQIYLEFDNVGWVYNVK